MWRNKRINIKIAPSDIRDKKLISGGVFYLGEDHYVVMVKWKINILTFTLEYRIICNWDVFPAIPSKIYIGLNCKEEYRKKLIDVGRSIDACKVYQMEFDEDSIVFGLKQRLL